MNAAAFDGSSGGLVGSMMMGGFRSAGMIQNIVWFRKGFQMAGILVLLARAMIHDGLWIG
jgi:hypothetical protein